VLQTGMAKLVNDWSLDGRYLLYTEATTSLDLFALPDPLGTGERKPKWRIRDSTNRRASFRRTADGWPTHRTNRADTRSM
jgi:hypothetical protein